MASENKVKFDSTEAMVQYFKQHTHIATIRRVHYLVGAYMRYVAVNMRNDDRYAPTGVTYEAALELAEHQYDAEDGNISDELKAKYEEYSWVIREVWRQDHEPAFKRPSWLESLPYERRQALWHHFPHRSVEKPDDYGFVAYTPNHEYGKRDRQVRVKIGKYLTQFYGDVVSEAAIRAIVNRDKPLTLLFGEDADAFETAYRAVNDSCMGGDLDGFSECVDQHPVRVYATEFKDFKIAVLAPGESPELENAVARAIVFRDKNFVRVYGSEATALREQLEARGLRYGGDFEGGRLAKIELEQDEDGTPYLMPYIDGDANYIVDIGNHFRITGNPPTGAVQARSTGGCIYYEERRDCHCCGATVRESQMQYSEHYDAYYCYSCVRRGHVVEAETPTGVTWVPDHNTIDIDGTRYLDDSDFLENEGWVRCEVSGEYFSRDDALATIDDEYLNPAATVCFVAGVERYSGEQRYASVDNITKSVYLLYMLRPGEGGAPAVPVVYGLRMGASNTAAHATEVPDDALNGEAWEDDAQRGAGTLRAMARQYPVIELRWMQPYEHSENDDIVNVIDNLINYERRAQKREEERAAEEAKSAALAAQVIAQRALSEPTDGAMAVDQAMTELLHQRVVSPSYPAPERIEQLRTQYANLTVTSPMYFNPDWVPITQPTQLPDILRYEARMTRAEYEAFQQEAIFNNLRFAETPMAVCHDENTFTVSWSEFSVR